MPPLSNPRHERFARALFEGHTADESYVLAGFKPNDGNCIRLKGNERVQTRLAELQAEAAKSSEVTVQSLLSELEEARSQASSLDQLSAATAAIMGKAKIAGLLRDRVEIGGPGDFDSCNSVEAVASKLLQEPMVRFRAVDEQDRQGLADLLQRHGDEVQEYLAAINARPVTVTTVQSPAEARRRLGFLDHGRS